MDARHAIEALIFGYADRIDAGDFVGVGALFRDGAITMADGTVVAAGAEAVTRLYEATTRRYDDGTPHTSHLVTNLSIRVDEARSTATADSRFTVLQARPDLALQPIVHGRYHDTFVRTDGLWRWATRSMDPTMWGDVSKHLLIGVPEADS